MRIVNCDKGHFYDADMFDKCPHCNEQINNDIPLQSTSVLRNKMKVEAELTKEASIPAKTAVAENIEIPEKVELGDNAEKKLVVGWLVCISDADKGKVSTIYEGSNNIYGLNIVFNDDLNRLYFNIDGSDVIPDLNNRKISESQYIYDQDKIRIGENTYMVVELCRDGFTWKVKKTDERTNSEILRSMWKCIVCGAMNGEHDKYCLVCGAERQ